MPAVYQSYLPKSLSEIDDLLGAMMLCSPTFVDKSGFFTDQNIDTMFNALNAGLTLQKSYLGEEKYIYLLGMAERMRAHFEADPENETDDTLKGRELIDEMSNILLKHHRATKMGSST